MLDVKQKKRYSWKPLKKQRGFQVFEVQTEGIKCVKLSVNWKESGTHWALLRPTCTLWGSPVILRGLSAPVGMGSSWIIIICTPVLSCRGTTRQKQKQELPGAQKTIHSEGWIFCRVSKNRFYFDLSHKHSRRVWKDISSNLKGSIFKSKSLQKAQYFCWTPQIFSLSKHYLKCIWRRMFPAADVVL